MKAELISFGFIIGGPEGAAYVSSREEIEPRIAELSAAEQHDSDDYTATEVFAKGWTGIVIPEVLESTRPRNWDESFQSSLPTFSAVAPPPVLEGWAERIADSLMMDAVTDKWSGRDAIVAAVQKALAQPPEAAK